MTRRIVVTSNCQTGGIAATLQAIFTRDTVIPIPLTLLDGGPHHAASMDAVRAADIWVTGIDPARFGCHDGSPRIIRIPSIHFEAFHPDIGYVLPGPNEPPIEPNYNSVIAVWAYVNQISVKDAAKLFTYDVFRDLGYLTLWDAQTQQLRDVFSKTDVEFTPFFRFAKRQGVFMYSLNHPTAEVLIFLAKQVALKLGASDSVWDQEIKIADELSTLVWPIYPEIANFYSINGSYLWKFPGPMYIEGLADYLDFAYANMERSRLQKEHIVLQRSISELDDILLRNLKWAA